MQEIASLVRTLRSRGLTFEEYDLPTLKTANGIADLGFARGAWFKDSEGNLIGIAQMVTA
ncbi:MAG TPA: hypothetical protein VET65_14835 [Candidatus Limnocylindrales bacterium]|nr:hypothetical protein [Candidatus Limnocylindrales bacterium]